MQENGYDYEPTGTTFCEGDSITVFRTNKGSYTVEVVDPIEDICDSACFTECFDNCGYVEVQGCYLRCIKGCTNGVCPNWAEVEVCYEYQNRIDCNVSCYNQCYGSYDDET